MHPGTGWLTVCLTDTVVHLSKTVDLGHVCGSGQAALDCMATQPWPDLPGHCLGEAAYRGLEVCLSGNCATHSVIMFLLCQLHLWCMPDAMKLSLAATFL